MKCITHSRLFGALIVLLAAASDGGAAGNGPDSAAPKGIPTHGRTYTIEGLPQSDYTMDAVYEHGTLTPLSCAGTAAYIIAPKGPVASRKAPLPSCWNSRGQTN